VVSPQLSILANIAQIARILTAIFLQLRHFATKFSRYSADASRFEARSAPSKDLDSVKWRPAPAKTVDAVFILYIPAARRLPSCQSHVSPIVWKMARNQPSGKWGHARVSPRLRCVAAPTLSGGLDHPLPVADRDLLLSEPVRRATLAEKAPVFVECQLGSENFPIDGHDLS
jgi:hypothetical protein